MENHQLTKRERRELLQQEKKQKEDQTKKSHKIKKRIKIISIIIAVIGIGMIFWFTSNKTTVPTNELLTVVSDDWVKGNKDTPVTIIEYLDFECEACGAYYPLVKRLSQEYGDKVAFITRYFPLPGHRNSMTSASAVESAGKQGKYWEMYDAVFENQSFWGEKETPEPAIFEEYAKQLGLDLNKFKQDVLSQEVNDRIERDKKSGTKLGIQGTPTFFINGKKIENPRGYEDFKKIIDRAIEN